VTTPDKFFVIEAEDGVIRVQELGVEDDLDTIRIPIEELYSTNLVQDRVVCIVGHVVGHDRGERIAAEGEDATLEQNLVFGGEELGRIGNFGAVLAVCRDRIFVSKARTKRERARAHPVYRAVFSNSLAPIRF
jgi:hypothetical protein